MSDLISKNALIEEVEKSMRENPHKDSIHKGCHNHEHRHFLLMIAKQPPVDAVPARYGEWLYKNYVWHCSLCDCHPYKGYIPAVPNYAFCPGCGAKMIHEGELILPENKLKEYLEEIGLDQEQKEKYFFAKGGVV